MRFTYRAILAFAVFAGAPATVAAPLSSGSSRRCAARSIPRYPAAPPSEAAQALARRIGTEANLDGVRAIIAMRDVRLLTVAVQSFNLGNARVLPEPVEALLIEFYADPAISPRLFGFLGRSSDLETGPYPKYRSRKLFDLLYADMSANPKDAFFITSRIVATDLAGIEPQLIAALAGLKPEAAIPIVQLLGLRRHQPAVPALRALQASTPHARDVGGLLAIINAALLRIGTPDAVQAVLDRIRKLNAESGDPRAGQEIAAILYRRPGCRPARARMSPRRAPPCPPSSVPTSSAPRCRPIAVRKDRRGVPELVSAVGRGNEEALEALLALGGPTDWNAARLKLCRRPRSGAEAGAARADGTSASTARLAIRRASWPNAASRSACRRSARRARSSIDKAAAASRRASDPKPYAADTEIALKGAEGLLAANAGRDEARPYRRETAQALQRLAAFTRFTLRDPTRAAPLYERAIALSEALPDMENISLMERISLADTLRFDLKEPRKAQRIYEQLQQRIARDPPPTNDIEAVLLRLVAEWLRVEIAYLGEGRRYAGTPDRDTLGAIAMVTYYGDPLFRADDAALVAIATALRTRNERERERRARTAARGPVAVAGAHPGRLRLAAAAGVAGSGSRASCAGTIRRRSSVPAPSRPGTCSRRAPPAGRRRRRRACASSPGPRATVN